MKRACLPGIESSIFFLVLPARSLVLALYVIQRSLYKIIKLEFLGFDNPQIEISLRLKVCAFSAVSLTAVSSLLYFHLFVYVREIYERGPSVIYTLKVILKNRGF